MKRWKRVSRHLSGRERSTPRPERCCSGPLLLAAVVAMTGLIAVRSPGGRAQSGCGSGLAPATKTPGGLPHESGEASGFVTSTRYPGWAWMIRDSSHPASLYALKVSPDGTATSREIPVSGATNRDWEDITLATRPDGTSVIWVIESGQGGSSGRQIYEVVEPDPETTTTVQATRYNYAYPDRSTNTEAAFTWDNQLVLASKNFPTRLYRFAEPLSTAGVNKATFVGELTDSNGISVAKPSPDGRWLVTATHERVYVYRRPPGSTGLEGFTNREPTHMVVAAPEDNVEAGDFFPAGACDLLLVSETRNTYRLESH
jgi:hypothetical protein